MSSLFRAVQLGLLLSLATAAAPVLADGGPTNRQGFGKRNAEALSQLTSRERQGYFNGLRGLERRRFDQRQADLSSLERCLNARSTSSITCFQENRQQGAEQRLKWRRDLQALRQRYNLPAMPEREQRSGEHHWKRG